MVLATNGDACSHWIKTTHITTFVTLNRILLEQNHMPFCDPDESVTQPERLIVDTCTRLCLDRSDGGARDVNRNLKTTGRAGTESHIFLSGALRKEGQAGYLPLHAWLDWEPHSFYLTLLSVQRPATIHETCQAFAQLSTMGREHCPSVAEPTFFDHLPEAALAQSLPFMLVKRFISVGPKMYNSSWVSVSNRGHDIWLLVG